jgi:hypothetical protein
MVIYAQRVRQQLVGQEVASVAPTHEPRFVVATCPQTLETQGMTLPIERPIAGCGMPRANGANAWLGAAVLVDVPAAVRLSSPTTTTKRDAFAGISPGPSSFMSPPV